MRDRFHRIYLADGMERVVDVLRQGGVGVSYDPLHHDPDHANGYLEQDGGVISSCDRWRSYNNSFLSARIPDAAKACIEVRTGFQKFGLVCSIVEQLCTVVREKSGL